MIKQRWLIGLLVFGSYAGACPQLEGTFRCRSGEPFDLSVQNELQPGGYASYTMSDPTGVRNIVADGRPHELAFHNGKGQYIARCEGNQLLVEASSPDGNHLFDRYYIERAALVRVRLSQQHQPSSLSCAPTGGTWRLYPH